jgi:hypothetical protein
MKVSQQIDAGRLTGSWIRYDGTFQLEFGDNEVTFSCDETQLRQLNKRIDKQLDEIEEGRAKKEEEEAVYE